MGASKKALVLTKALTKAWLMESCIGKGLQVAFFAIVDDKMQ